MAVHEQMEYGTVRIISLHSSTQDRLLEDSKPRRDRDQRPKTRSMDQLIKLTHCCVTQCMHYALLVHFAAKI